MQYSRNDIYVTKLDYERLTALVKHPHPACSPELVTALQQKLTHVQLVDSYNILPDVITMNSRLKLKAMHRDEELHFTLVYPQHADETSQRVSVLSPVGMAVLGCRLGDRVQLPTPTEPAIYWVEAILHQPEAAGDWIS